MLLAPGEGGISVGDWLRRNRRGVRDFLITHGFARLLTLDKDELGLWGEELAVRELRRRDYRILERRWSCRLGEIDTVALDGEVLVFVEVKTRRREHLFSPIEAVDWKKQRKLLQLADAYLSRHPRLADRGARFDFVGVTAEPGAKPVVELVRDAFEESRS